MKLISFVILTSCLFLLAITRGDGQPTEPVPVRASGTFIQHSLVKGWDDTAWQNELRRLKEIGFEYLVIGPAAETRSDGKTVVYYDSDIKGVIKSADVLDACLRNAARMEFKVFVGLSFAENWWREFDADWMEQETQKEMRYAEEIMRKYGERYPTALYGWYWFWEVDNVRFPSVEKRKIIANAIRESRAFLHRIAPGKPFMLCPFMNSKYGTAVAYSNFWKEVFADVSFQRGDIFAPQDCAGAGGLKAEEVGEWFRELAKAVRTVPGLLFWADVETFDQRFWTSIPIGVFLDRMKAVQPYVSTILTFAYSHYYSPGTVADGFHKTYRYYVNHGKLPSETRKLSLPGRIVRYSAADSSVHVVWDRAVGGDSVAGYRLFSGGVQIADVQGKKLKQKQIQLPIKRLLTNDSLRIEVYGFGGTLLASQSQPVN